MNYSQQDDVKYSKNMNTLEGLNLSSIHSQEIPFLSHTALKERWGRGTFLLCFVLFSFEIA